MSEVTLTIDEADLDGASDALSAWGIVFTVKRPARRTAAPVVVFAPNTGDVALDEWMRAHWRPADTVAAAKRRELPKPSKLPAKMTNVERGRVRAFNARAIQAWRDAGHEVIIERLPRNPNDPSNYDYVALDGRNVRVLPLGVTS